jgi:hypothetical protein
MWFEQNNPKLETSSILKSVQISKVRHLSIHVGQIRNVPKLKTREVGTNEEFQLRKK